jgi:hypothetical protein
LPVTKDAVYGIGHLQDPGTDLCEIQVEFNMALRQSINSSCHSFWISPVWLGWDIRFAPMKSYPDMMNC